MTLRGVGDTRWCLFITTGSSYLVRLPLAWWLGVKLEMGIAGVWWALMGELTLRAVLLDCGSGAGLGNQPKFEVQFRLG